MVEPAKRPLYPPGYDQATIDAKIAAAIAASTIPEFGATDPSAPASSVTLFARKRANRDLLGFVGPTDLPVELAPHLGMRGVAFAKAIGGAVTTPSGAGFSNTANGTPTIAALASTNIRTQSRRLSYVSAAGAGSSAGWIHNILSVWRGNAAKLGGFHLIMRFSLQTLPATFRIFCGLCDSTAALANVQPSTLTNMLGVAFDSTDTDWQFLQTDGAATRVKQDLPGLIPSTSEVYEMRLYCQPNDTTVYVSFQALGAGTLYEMALNTHIPANTQFLAPQLWINNASTASACAIDFISAYLETDY